jgi:hypothetical protein
MGMPYSWAIRAVTVEDAEGFFTLHPPRLPPARKILTMAAA